MAMIKDRDKKKVGELLSRLADPVRILVFTQETECLFCLQTRELVEEVGTLSDKLSVEVLDFVADAERARALGVDKIPAVVLLGPKDRDYGLRLFGIPSGYEFMSLLEGIQLAAGGDSGLSPDSRRKLAGITAPVALQVFVTPTCPYCPRAVVTAFRLAVESEHISAAMVESSEFPHLANRYQVSGVPHTVIGDSLQPMVGAYPEAAAVDMILAALSGARGAS
jgi:glutaredoxin-like protein